MVKHIRSESRSLLKNLLEEERVQRYITSLRRHHYETQRHSVRVGLFAVDLGYENSFGLGELKLLGYAGLLHDVGKLDIPEEILNKPTALNQSERAIIDVHPRLGFLALEDFGDDLVRQVVVAHHEYKKNPYPRGKKDRRKTMRLGDVDRRTSNRLISILAQIVAVSDIYDALTHRRTYKSALPRDKVEETLREHFIGDKNYIEQVLRESA